MQPYQGIRGDELREAQRSVLMTTLDVHVGWARPDHAAVRAEQIADHLDETWFSWLGGTTGDEPFYYRIHNPVVLVEFDQHGGVVFDNAEPSRHHIHTIIRTPNGGDYGLDLLAQHHARCDHSTGSHDIGNQLTQTSGSVRSSLAVIVGPQFTEVTRTRVHPGLSTVPVLPPPDIVLSAVELADLRGRLCRNSRACGYGADQSVGAQRSPCSLYVRSCAV